MTMLCRHRLRVSGYLIAAILLWVMLAVQTLAAPFAAVVMDARTGEILYEKNANARLHPASLTKMMTLYIAFEAIEHGEISLDSMVTISANAAGQQPSRLGLRKGQKIALRYLIRAAAIKSANDAAMAIGEAIGGSQEQFARRMNRTAKALGMKNSTFRNPNGLTAEGHLSSAMDMTILGRRLFYDFPQYYGIFSRRTADAGMAQVANTNRRFLDAYEGADGIKTGYTVPAGFNLTASAERDGVRIITTVFGGTSTAQRNAKVAELMDLGFDRAPRRAREQRPTPPEYVAEAPAAPDADDALAEQVAASVNVGDAPAAGKTIRVSGAPETSLRPQPRPGAAAPEAPAPDAAVLAAIDEGVAAALAEVVETSAPLPGAPEPAPATVVAEVEAQETPLPETLLAPEGAAALTAPAPRPAPVEVAEAAPSEEEVLIAAPAPAPAAAEPQIAFVQTTEPQPETLALAAAAAPQPQPEVLFAASSGASLPTPDTLEVVTRASTSGGRNFGINVGKFGSVYEAEKMLMKTALTESATLDEALRKVVNARNGFDATFLGLTREDAELACRKLIARGTDCSVIGS